MTTLTKEEQYQTIEDDFNLLFELGFVALKQSDFTSSTQLFQAITAIDPDDTSHQFGLACIAMYKLELDKSAELFKKYLTSNPQNERVRICLGLVYILSLEKTKEGEKIVQEVLDKTTNPPIKDLAKRVLEWSAKNTDKKVAFNSSQTTSDGKKKFQI